MLRSWWGKSKVWLDQWLLPKQLRQPGYFVLPATLDGYLLIAHLTETGAKLHRCFKLPDDLVIFRSNLWPWKKYHVLVADGIDNPSFFVAYHIAANIAAQIPKPFAVNFLAYLNTLEVEKPYFEPAETTPIAYNSIR